MQNIAISRFNWLATSVIVVIIIAIFSISVISYTQQMTTQDIRGHLFQKTEQSQARITRSISRQMSSDFDSIAGRLQTAAVSLDLQQSKVVGEEENGTKAILQELLRQPMATMQGTVDMLYVLDNSNRVVSAIDSQGEKMASFADFDFSKKSFVNETRTSMMPVFSNEYIGADGKSKITITYPIISRNTGRYHGLVGAEILPEILFQQYWSNNDEYNSTSYLTVLDRSGTFLAGPNPPIVGKSFFDKQAQHEFPHDNPDVIGLYEQVLSGQRKESVFDAGLGERLVVGEPVNIYGKSWYYVFLGIPTALIYSDIQSALVQQNYESIYQMVGLVVAVLVLILFLFRLNARLRKDIEEGTKKLAELNLQLVNSNEMLNTKNEQLEGHSKMQVEFANIAAHELRTPIQPIIGMIDVLNQRLHQSRARGRNTVELTEEQLALMDRNATRLQKLCSEILDATRIEAGTLRLHREPADISQEVRNAIEEVRSTIPKDQNVEIQFKISTKMQSSPTELTELVLIDKLKISEVISNLLRNAITYSSSSCAKPGAGTIEVMCEKIREESWIKVSIKDRGPGIAREMFPRLFTKFLADKELGGTGLGLFIAKSVVEAHGGKIWAENNSDGAGATFAFTLPVEPIEKV